MTAWLGAGGKSQEAVNGRSQEQDKEQDKEQEARGQGHEAPQKSGRRRQRVILNGKASQWHAVTASIVQGSVMGPTLAKCFSNSSHEGRVLLERDKPLLSKFADDEKRCRVVMNQEQGDRMQQDINKDHQRMMVDPMFMIVQSLWSFLTAVTTTAVAPIAVIFTCIYLNIHKIT